mgnify:FL=1
MNELMDDGTSFLARELCTYLLSDQSSTDYIIIIMINDMCIMYVLHASYHHIKLHCSTPL